MPRPPAGLPYPASNVGIIAPPPPPQRLQMMPMVSVKPQFWVRVLLVYWFAQFGPVLSRFESDQLSNHEDGA